MQSLKKPVSYPSRAEGRQASLRQASLKNRNPRRLAVSAIAGKQHRETQTFLNAALLSNSQRTD